MECDDDSNRSDVYCVWRDVWETGQLYASVTTLPLVLGCPQLTGRMHEVRRYVQCVSTPERERVCRIGCFRADNNNDSDLLLPPLSQVEYMYSWSAVQSYHNSRGLFTRWDDWQVKLQTLSPGQLGVCSTHWGQEWINPQPSVITDLNIGFSSPKIFGRLVGISIL